jgi:superfamily I DNA/RNA helicase
MLTEEQAGTIKEPDEHKLIIALPGSGKTFTFISLAEAILKMDDNHSVMLVTFTNAAAGEMKQRIEKRLGKQMARRTKSATFASLMMHQFRQISHGRKPVIGAEQYTFVKRALASLNMNTDEIEEWLAKIEQMGRDLNHISDDTPSSKVFERYVEILNDDNRYDLNLMARELIHGMRNGEVKPYTHTHLLVDEFQDTDAIQLEWISCMGEVGAKIAVVGDDDQSIYSWRGSLGFEAFQEFKERFGASAYVLSRCFRCAPAILKSAKGFIENNEDRLDKEMVSAVTDEGKVTKVPIPPEFISKYLMKKSMQDELEIRKDKNKKQSKADDKKFENYRFVAEKIEDSQKSGWAVLARTNKQLDHMERAFTELGIKVLRIGGKSIFDNVHAVSMINLFLSLIQDKAASELVSGLGWIGESEVNLKRIYTESRRSGFASISQLSDSPWSPITSYLQSISQLAKQCREQDAEKYIEKWAKVMRRIIKKMDDKEKVLQETILDIIINILKGSRGDLIARALNLVDKTQGVKPSKAKDDDTDFVTLSTFNSSKGLEWENVWLIDMDAGVIPMLKDDISISAIEEERRLVYVAMTRAERELYLSYRADEESVFIEEIEGVIGGI